MANKTGQTTFEPVASDVRSITFVLQDGAVVGIETDCVVRQTDTKTRYQCDPESLKSVPADFSQKIQDAFADLPAAVAADVATKEGFA